TCTGSDADTKGIWITPEPIDQILDNGDKVAIFVADCQGIEEQKLGQFGLTTVDENTIDQQILTIGQLMATHSLYNLMGLWKNQDIQMVTKFLLSVQTVRVKDK